MRGGLVRALSESLLFEGEAGYSQRSVAYYAPYFASADSVAGGYPGGPNRTHLESWETTFTPRVKAEWGRGIHSVMGYDLSRSQEKYGDSYGPLAEQSILDNQGFGYYNNLLTDTQRAALTSHSVYMITRAPLGNQLEVSGGFRRQLDAVQAQDANISAPGGPISQTRSYSANAYDLGLNRQYGLGQRAYIKWSQSFRFANLDEFWGFDPNTYERVFSGILKPQISRTWEVGSTWRPGTARVDLSAFESRTQDEIRYDPTTYYNTNSADGIVRRGVLFDLKTPLGSQWEASAGGRLQRSIYAGGDAIGHTIALVPDTVLRAGLTWRSNSHWASGAFVRHVGRQYYDGDRDNALARMPSATTADLFTRYTEGRWELRLALKNATGKHYATYGGYGYLLQPAGTGASNYYYYPGDPRTLLLTMRVKF
jgi:iron complex outermembrane receptor protein